MAQASLGGWGIGDKGEGRKGGWALECGCRKVGAEWPRACQFHFPACTHSLCIRSVSYRILSGGGNRIHSDQYSSEGH